MRIAFASSILVCLTATFLGAQPQQALINGEWVGDARVGGDSQLAMLHITREGTRYQGTLELPFAGQRLSLADFKLDGTTITVNVSDGSNIRTVVGTLQNGMLTAGDAFNFAHIAQIDSSKYDGAYETGSGDFISISAWPEQSMGALTRSVLQYADTKTGRFGSLFPVSETKMVSGGPIARVFPIEVEVSFSKNRAGLITGLTWREKGRPEVRASRRLSTYREEEVTFANGDVTLAGTLLVPRGRGRHPAIVLTHGSGPQIRQRGVLEQLFVRAGFAVLSYDKRGVGSSKGDWQTSSFEDLASDAVAGARMLQTRQDIEPAKIGFWGLSQGAWIAPLAAARFDRPAFVIAASGGSLSPERQELLDTESELHDAGFSAGDISDALAFQTTKNAFMRTGEGWEAYAALRQRVLSQKWYGYGNTDAHGPPSRTNPAWLNQRKYYFYEPSVTLEKLTCPVLLVFGALGNSAHALEESLSAARSSSLERGNNPSDVTVRVIPKAGHNLLFEEQDPQRALTTERLRYVPGYPQLLVKWAEQQLKTPPRRSRLPVR